MYNTAILWTPNSGHCWQMVVFQRSIMLLYVCCCRQRFLIGGGLYGQMVVGLHHSNLRTNPVRTSIRSNSIQGYPIWRYHICSYFIRSCLMKYYSFEVVPHCNRNSSCVEIKWTAKLDSRVLPSLHAELLLESEIVVSGSIGSE